MSISGKFPLRNLWTALSIAASCMPPVRCETTAHYLDVNSSGMTVEVRVNGCTLHQSDGWEGSSGSVFLGPFLVDGKNEISWTALTSPSTAGGKPGWVEVEIMSAPADSLRSAEAPGTPLYAKRVTPLASATLLPAPEEKDREILCGDISGENGTAIFRNIAPRRWAWGMRIGDPGRSIAGSPAKLLHSGISSTLAAGEIHFMRSGTDRHVVFSGLKFPRGGGEIGFTRDAVSRGARFFDEGGFDTIWIFGSSAEGVEEVKLAMLSVESVVGKYGETATFDAEVGVRWLWQRAEDTGPLDKGSEERGALVDHLRGIHEAMDTRPPEEWIPHFETKVAELAKATGRDAAELGGEQLAFFRSLAGIEGWKLEPFDEERLLLRQVNPRLVRVSYIESEGPIQSVPLPKPGEPGVLDRFTIPLYLAKIDGHWTVVR